MVLCLLPLLVVPASLACSLCRTDPNRIKFFAALVFSSVFLSKSPRLFRWLAVSAGLLLALAFQSDMKAGARLRGCCRNAVYFFSFWFWAFDLIFLIKFLLRRCQGYTPILLELISFSSSYSSWPMMIVRVGMMCVFYKSSVVGSVSDLRALIGRPCFGYS